MLDNIQNYTSTSETTPKFAPTTTNSGPTPCTDLSHSLPDLQGCTGHFEMGI